MHPLGCFGSSLAFDPQTAVCQGCSARTDCEAKVRARYPQLQLLLSRFTDAKGEMMSVHWMTPEDKKALKDSRKEEALAEAEGRTFGDRQVARSLRAGIDDRARSLFDAMCMDAINPMTVALDTLAKVSSAMGSVLGVLQSKPRSTITELTVAIAQSEGLSAATAKRDAQALTSILIAADRAQRVGPYKSPEYELK